MMELEQEKISQMICIKRCQFNNEVHVEKIGRHIHLKFYQGYAETQRHHLN